MSEQNKRRHVSAAMVRAAWIQGSRLVRVSGQDISTWPLAAILEAIGALAHEPRELVFQLPDTVTSRHSLEDLDKRRQLEVALILQHDTSTFERKKCWCMMSATWMNDWIAFVARGAPVPITNEALLAPGWEALVNGQALGRADTPCQELVLCQDYRGMVWCVLVALHGGRSTPVTGRCVQGREREKNASTSQWKSKTRPYRPMHSLNLDNGQSKRVGTMRLMNRVDRCWIFMAKPWMRSNWRAYWRSSRDAGQCFEGAVLPLI